MRVHFFILTLLIATSVAHSQDEIKSERPYGMSADVASHKQAITTLFEKCFNQGQIELLPDLIGSDYQGPNGQIGPSAFASTITSLRATLPDLRYTLEDMVGEGDRVAVRWQLEGTQNGEFRGFPASHRHVKTSGMAIFRFKDNRIAGSRVLMDQLGFLQQIGVLPSEIKPTTLPEKRESSKP
jgi:steroid delta-isomerase-like uncharacterized protein